ncbi:hypothetical protein H6M51_08080 [Rhizobium sp. AQ_MP]|uniref:hypothetical protein n=1 Tax=Rhizobium sp. AQ_MP TaxID=2761536 RepID=UPI00163A4F0F|nr:hypothetical protein [Rhizobium sp. AQ_MP]MBC2772816.1 hypothetical protein [Rhizobium sp. AQ_MP]
MGVQSIRVFEYLMRQKRQPMAQKDQEEAEIGKKLHVQTRRSVSAEALFDVIGCIACRRLKA